MSTGRQSIETRCNRSLATTLSNAFVKASPKRSVPSKLEPLIWPSKRRFWRNSVIRTLSIFTVRLPGAYPRPSGSVQASSFLVLDLLADTLDKKLARWRREKTASVRNTRRRQMDRIENVARGVAKGLSYLHSRQILYRDLSKCTLDCFRRILPRKSLILFN